MYARSARAQGFGFDVLGISGTRVLNLGARKASVGLDRFGLWISIHLWMKWLVVLVKK